MKKHIILALALALSATGAFAAEVGFGMLFNNGTNDNYGSVVIYSKPASPSDPSPSDPSHNTHNYTEALRLSDFGLYGFFGWKYFSIDLGLRFRKKEYTYTGELPKDDSPYQDSAEELTSFQIGLNFKLPITVSRSFRFYPTIGADIGIGEPYGLDAGSVHGGLGADIVLYKNMYLHLTGLYNYNLYDFGGGFLFKFGLGWVL